MKKMVIIGSAIIFLILFSVSAFILAQEEGTVIGKDDAIIKALNALEPAKAEDAGLGKTQAAKANIVTPSLVPSPTKKIIIDTLELKDMDIADVLKLISQKSGLNIVAGRNVQAKVTIYLKDVDVWDALRIILETNDLAYEQEGNIIKIITARDYELLFGNRFGDKSQVKIVPLQYAAAG
ncbi:MAG: secretin and TonB N-terminal domain-containing protein, partial [Candidatus Omnitrophota bacterium]|nr:secretin and TonB N-terminal domain-containing protein [Candidatus Omnitrophota bacterium]